MAALIRLVGVYNAEGTWQGELRYVLGKLAGTAHCALCDVTHGWTGEKQTFRRCRASFEVPLELVHLDEQDEVTRRVSSGRTPCVIVITDEGPRMLMDSEALGACEGRVEAFEQALRRAIEGLSSAPQGEPASPRG
jgi:hypothetical protein